MASEPCSASIVVKDQHASGLLSLCSSCQNCLAKVCQEHVDGSWSLTYNQIKESLGRVSNHQIHDTYNDWSEAMRGGCWICCRLWEYVPSLILEKLANKSITSGAVTCSATMKMDRCFSLSIKTGQYQMGLTVRRAYPGMSQTVVLEVGTTTNSSAAWKTVSKWLDNCIHRHEYCGSLKLSQDTAWYPTRLLDLGDSANENANLKVIDTANEKLEGSYITLSHCWGEGNHMLLTKENKTILQNEIPDLPRTFTEAIFVCRKLGIRYLWIDSLCIVQDDPEDWAREAALMQHVYSRAWCNLSATASRHSDEGLFRERKEYVVGQLTINLKGIGRVSITEEDPFAQIEVSPLQNRAWVLQERLLSKRILHFGNTQIFWECGHLSACESFPNGIPRDGSDSGMRSIFGMETKKDPVTAWRSIVENYTRRSITYTSDKLPALSGIVKNLNPVLGGIYLAGIWNNKNLIYDLGWATMVRRSDLRPRPQYRAPTWSWASIDDSVKFMRLPGSLCIPHVTVIDAYVEPIGTDESIAVRSGYLLVRGHLKRVGIDEQKMFHRFKLHFDACEETPSELFFLPLYLEHFARFSQNENESFTTSNNYSRYLILVADPDHPTWYKRVGLATTEHFTVGRNPKDDLDKWVLVNAGPRIPCERYLGPGEEEGHVIRIV